MIIPVYNGERFLKEAIDSVRIQTTEPLDVIVVDDGSTDRSVEIASSYGSQVRIVQHEKNRGPSAARNTGIRLALHDVVAFLDADDLWKKDALHRRIEMLERDPRVSVVLGHVERTIQKDVPIVCSSLGSAIFRKTVFETVGLLDERLRFGEDVDFFLRIKETALKIGIIPQTVQIYRIHDENSTRNIDPYETGLLQILHRSIRRRNGK